MKRNIPSKPLVLLVENDPATRALISLRLTRMGCEVQAAADGLDGITRLEENPPKILILDTYLPKLGGLDVLKQARASDLLKNTKVVILSSLGFHEVVQQAIQAGAHAFLMKPVDLDLLEDRIAPFLKSP